MQYLLGIDLGSTNLKASIVTYSGLVASAATGRVSYRDSGPGCREIAVDEFSACLLGVVQECLGRAGIAAAAIAAVSYASQANTFLLADQRLRPLTPLISWADRRALDVTLATIPLVPTEHFAARTGMGVDSSLVAPRKLKWFRQHQPSIWQRTGCVLSICDLLGYLLTGEIVTDPATTALSGLYDLPDRRYRAEALNEIELSCAMLPTVMDSGSVAGSTRGPLAKAIGLAPTAAFVVGSLDHHAAAIGSGIASSAAAVAGDRSASGEAGPRLVESLGTVLSVLSITDHPARWVGMVSGPHLVAGSFYQLAFADAGAAWLDWFQRRFAPQASIAAVIEQAAAEPAGAKGLRLSGPVPDDPSVIPFVSDGLPLTAEAVRTNIGRCARAILEHVAYTLRDDLLPRLAAAPGAAIVTTGGGAQSDTWIRLRSTICKRSYHRLTIAQPATRGAAFIAAIGIGWFDRDSDITAVWPARSRRFDPL